MRLPVSTELLIAEIRGAEDILRRNRERIEAGIPAIDEPGSELALEEFVGELCGELLVASGKCENLARVLTGSD